MKAIQVIKSIPTLVDFPDPEGEGIKVKVRTASICGSDVHMLNTEFADGAVLGHEFAGTTPDGRAVAVEPIYGCNVCTACEDGFTHHCSAGKVTFVGTFMAQGGMAEYVRVPAHTLVPLPSGLDISCASLVEPMAVSIHGVQRAELQSGERVLVIGAGAIGLATIAVLTAAGFSPDVIARHEQQKITAQRLGGQIVEDAGNYDAVLDCAGSPDSLRTAQERIRPMGRIALLGTLWEQVPIDMLLCQKEISLIPSMGYKTGETPGRTFNQAAQILAENPEIAANLITHRLPLDGVQEAFSAAADRAKGAIKVVFDI